MYIHRPVNTFLTYHYGISETPRPLSGAKRDLGGVTTQGCGIRKHSRFKRTCTHAIACLTVEQDTRNGAAVSCQLMAGCHNRLQEMRNTQVPEASDPLSFHWIMCRVLQHTGPFAEQDRYFLLLWQEEELCSMCSPGVIGDIFRHGTICRKTFWGASAICIKNEEWKSALC